jgi:hypothetical protein
MKVRMRKMMAGPAGVRSQGDIIDVPPHEAEMLIDTKAAEPYFEERTRETATLATVENASAERRPVKRVIRPRRGNGTETNSSSGD